MWQIDMEIFLYSLLIYLQLQFTNLDKINVKENKVPQNNQDNDIL